MEFSELQQLIIKVVERYRAKFNIPRDATDAQIKLHEEVGEFSKALVVYLRLARPSKRSDTETAKIALANESTDINGAFLEWGDLITPPAMPPQDQF